MKQILPSLLFIVFILSSCSKKKSLESNGGMYITMPKESFTTSQLDVLKNRIVTYSNMNGYNATMKSTRDSVSLRLPYFLSRKKLDYLIGTKGTLHVIAEDSTYFDTSFIEKTRTTFGAEGSKQISFQFRNKIQFEEFTKTFINTHIQIKLDSTLLMAPRIGNSIADGKMDIRILETDAHDSYTVYSILMAPYKNKRPSIKYQQQLFFKSAGALVKIPSNMHTLYSRIQNLLLQNKVALQADLKTEDQTTQLVIKKEMEAFLKNDLGGYLAASEFKDISEIKSSFSELHRVLQQYDANDEITTLIELINASTDYELFKT